ncbi:actin-based motility regulator RoaM [Rickettsia endosymbiont of Orchestes rusci]|uniref:actin-based motility regulator RoaM n=1 Tax=Rickettsia endosymbiont of Orchestes rusci TaxID=3066250 RepID=UPI00313DD8C5
MLSVNEIIKEKLNKLKAELENVYSRVQADYLLGDIKSLANEAAANGITVDISGLEKAVETKVKSFEVDKDIDKIQDQEEQILKAKRVQELIEREEKEAREKILKINNLYKNFKQNIDESIKKVEKENKDLDQITNKLKKENIVDHDLLNSRVLTHEEIKEQHEQHKQKYAYQTKVNEQHKQIHNKLENLNKNIKELKEQLKRKDITPEEAEKLQNNLAFQQERLKRHAPIVKEINELKNKTDKEVANYESHKYATQEKIKNLGKAITELPQKDQDTKDKHQALQNQYEAIIGTGVVKDIEGHNKILNKIRTRQVASKVKEQIQGKEQREGYNTILYPSKTPSNNLSNSKTRTIQ